MSANSLTTTSPTFILIDGHSLAFRAYFAFAKGRDGGLRTKTGIPTSVCFGFLKCLLEVIATEKPQAIAIAFDLGLPTFRHQADQTYKADRPDTPEDFIPDLENLHELLKALNIPILTAPGFEADDILGTLAQKTSQAGYQVKILSGDRDLFQLIDAEKQITVLNFTPDALKRSNGSIIEFRAEEVKQKLGILPTQVIDFKALCGDKSDNIPGVRGIGEKTAVQLLWEHHSLDQIYADLAKIKGAVQKKLELGRADAERSRFLATIVQDVPIEVNLADCQLTGFDVNVLTPILEKLEFKHYLTKIQELHQHLGGQVIETPFDETPISDHGEDSALWFFSAADTAAQADASKSIIQPQIIDTTDKLTALIERLEKLNQVASIVSWDTETTALEPRDAQLVGIGCCWGSQPDDVAYIPLGHKTGENLNREVVLEQLRPILESDRYPKALQNAKFDRLVLKCQGINLAGVVFDTMLASYLISPDSSHNLTDLSQRYLGLIPQSYQDLVPKGKTIADISIPVVANYCGMDAYCTFGLIPKLRAELEEVPNLLKLLLEVEQPLEPVLAEMEYRGIRIDSVYLGELSQQLSQQLGDLEQKATEIAGEKFNLSSPKQLSHILFEKLGLDTKYSRKIATGYSTDAATLEKLEEVDQSGFVSTIGEHRTLAKLKSTYVDALPALVRSDSQRVHTNFNQAATSTGRLSSSNPNLQNIPIRTEFSRQIRKAFLPEPGWLIVAADYSQIELRILAHLSQEPVLTQAYQQNEDIHSVTARLIFEKEDISSEERRLAKTINFGVIYGMGASKFARQTGIDSSNARIFIERFNQRYGQVFAYLEQVKKQAIARGYVETILGRRRYLEFTSDSLRKLKGVHPDEINLSALKNLGAYDAGLLRSAANAPIQGSSADIIKIAMVRLNEVLHDFQARLLLQVHDELVLEVPPEELDELKLRIKSVMENAVSLSVPLVVEVHSGENWMETK